MRNRYYNPINGRFNTEDPIRDGANWYVYCNSNPANFVDPLGLISVSDGKYNSDVLMQLTDYTYKYYDAKLSGGGQAGYYARKASVLRISQNERNIFDTKSMQIENNLIFADAKAKSLGFAEGSDEYGLTVLMYTQALNDIDEKGEQRYNQQLMFFALYSISDLNKNGTDNFTTNDKVIDAKNKAVDWLGKDAKTITNKNGDKVFMSADGTRRIRFDLNRPNPHNNPHGHVEELIEGVWKKSGPIYPNDVPHN